MSNQKNLTTNDTWFFGHPKGMVTLFFTEMWERMSYYGMRALLVLYMTGAVTGFNPGLGWSQVDAQAIYGIYVGMVYFMVIPGGWLADNVLGHQKAVLIGAIIIALGHFTLAIPLTETFFLGLILVVLGTGLLKGNISTIVGQLYKPGDSRVQAGYTIFYMSINIGSTLGFLICSWLGEKIGWHWGFGAAGVGMFFGVLQYINFKHLLGEAGNKPNDMPQVQRDSYIKWSKITAGLMVIVIALGLLGIITVEPRAFAENFAYFLTAVAAVYFVYLFLFAGLSATEKKNVFLLLILFVGAAAFWSGFDQSASSLSIFARDYTDLTLNGLSGSFGMEEGFPIGWLQFANPIFVVIFAPIFAGIWMHLGRMNLDPSLPVKFAIGLFFMALSFVVMIYAVNLAMEVSPVGVQWLVITYLLQTWGELALSPIGLSAFSQYAPKKYIGQMFGLWFLASAIGGVLAGLLGGEALDSGLESISPVFEFMIQYYVVIGLALIAVAVFGIAKSAEIAKAKKT
jgi:POT family proton-dependent oligopeptide transporter